MRASVTWPNRAIVQQVVAQIINRLALYLLGKLKEIENILSIIKESKMELSYGE